MMQYLRILRFPYIFCVPISDLTQTEALSVKLLHLILISIQQIDDQTINTYTTITYSCNCAFSARSFCNCLFSAVSFKTNSSPTRRSHEEFQPYNKKKNRKHSRAISSNSTNYLEVNQILNNFLAV